MKKIVVIMLTAVLMFTACGKEEAVENGRERVREETTEAGGEAAQPETAEETAEDTEEGNSKTDAAGKSVENETDESAENKTDESAANETDGAAENKTDGVAGNETDEPAESVTGTEAKEIFTDRANADTGTGSVKILSEGDVAPDFTAELVDGSSFRLSDHDNKVVLINFWATWCGPCVREMPAFEMLMADNMDGFELVCVNCMDDKSTVNSFVKENGYGFNIAYDTDGRIETYYPTDGIPYTIIVDHGIISKIYIGAMDAETQYREYKAAIKEALR